MGQPAESSGAGQDGALGPAAAAEVSEKGSGLAAGTVPGEQHPLPAAPVTRAEPGWGRQGHDIHDLLPCSCPCSWLLSLPRVPPVLPFGSRGAVPWLGWGQTEALVPNLGWVQPPMAHLCLAVDMSPCSVGGRDGTSVGGSPNPPWDAILPCWPWGRAGQEKVSADGLGILLCAW